MFAAHNNVIEILGGSRSDRNNFDTTLNLTIDAFRCCSLAIAARIIVDGYR
jgi:hypothetical protein